MKGVEPWDKPLHNVLMTEFRVLLATECMMEPFWIYFCWEEPIISQN